MGFGLIKKQLLHVKQTLCQIQHLFRCILQYPISDWDGKILLFHEIYCVDKLLFHFQRNPLAFQNVLQLHCQSSPKLVIQHIPEKIKSNWKQIIAQSLILLHDWQAGPRERIFTFLKDTYAEHHKPFFGLFLNFILIASKAFDHLVDNMEVEERLVFVNIFDDGVLLGLEGDVHFFEFHDLIELVLVKEVMEVVERRIFFHEVLDNGVEHV